MRKSPNNLKLDSWEKLEEGVEHRFEYSVLAISVKPTA
jgi:hypothetical protein